MIRDKAKLELIKIIAENQGLVLTYQGSKTLKDNKGREPRILGYCLLNKQGECEVGFSSGGKFFGAPISYVQGFLDRSLDKTVTDILV